MRVTALHVYPVKGCRRVDLDSAEVEPWGLAGDRRWLIVDARDARMITQREAPGLTAVHPEPLVGGGLTLRAAGQPAIQVPVPGRSELLDAHHFRVAIPATPAGELADRWLAAVLGREVRLVYLDDPARRTIDTPQSRPTDRVSFADAYPVLLASTASLAALNDWLAEDGGPAGTGGPAEPLPMTRFRPNIEVEGAPGWAEDDWVGGRLRVGGVPFRVADACGRCVVTTVDQDTGERGREPLRTLARYRQVAQRLLFGVHLIPDGPGTIAVGDPVVAPA